MREQVHEVDGRRVGGRAVVEGEGYLALGGWPVEHLRGSARHAPHQPGCMEGEQLGRGGKHEVATRARRERWNARGRAQGADDLPAERPVADRDLTGKEARRQLARAGASDRGGDRSRRTGALGADGRVLELRPGVPGASCDAGLPGGGAVGWPLDQQTQGAVVASQCAGRERRGELHVPQGIKAILRQGAGRDRERFVGGLRTHPPARCRGRLRRCHGASLAAGGACNPGCRGEQHADREQAPDPGGAPSGREACATVMFEASPFAHGPIVAAGLGVVIRPDPRRLYAYFRSLGTVVGVGIGPLRRELEALTPDGLVRGLVSLMSWHSPLSSQVTGMSFRPASLTPLSRAPDGPPRPPTVGRPLSGRGARLRRRGPD